eukprot:TRINITY_DN1863_c0_g1_i2.p1 TRINITY_DN1863_c0_g1~~TRINITY_DN1863_c0_g1_i2.p1  ORF type:complete len:533 (+),score=140.53 TRINITY_DN1863_c0_g1_i2:154-1752(+)
MQIKCDKLDVKPEAMCYTSGQLLPIWAHKVPAMPKFQPLASNENADVCVVGAGISGLTTAYFMAKEGKSVVVIDDGEVSSGETGRSSAHLMSAVDDRYFEIQKKHGKEAARLVADFHKMAIDVMEQICKEENIDAEFKRVSGYLVCGPEHSDDLLEKEMNAAREAGMACEMSTAPVPQGSVDQGKKALMFPNQGEIHIQKYMKGLTEACVRRGVRIYTQTRGISFKEESTVVTSTNRGPTITSRYLVLATCTPVNEKFIMHTKLEPMRTYMVVAKVPKGSVQRSLLWTTSDPYVYARLSDGEDDQTDYLLVGGEDHPVGVKTNFDERYNNLIKWTRERYPVVQGFVSKWSGQVFEPIDDIAFIGHNPGSPENIFIITGDSGNGITHGTAGARHITDMAMGKANQGWQKLYDPSRQMTSEIMEFVKHNAHVQMQYKDWITPGELKDIEDLKPGCGGILRKGLHKYAVYRDDGGKLNACSATCTHLAAIVSWNESEKSFDCPCHGSRFDPYGMVITGPAVKDLQPQDISTLSKI